MLLTLEIDGLGGPQNNFGLILRTPVRLHGVEGKWVRKKYTEESGCQITLGKRKDSFCSNSGWNKKGVNNDTEILCSGTEINDPNLLNKAEGLDFLVYVCLLFIGFVA